MSGYSASIDTVLYGVAYAAGASIDITGWNRRQLTQCLGTGMITMSTPGAGDAYTHTQAVPASVWDITHALPFIPSVTVIDSSGDMVMSSIEYLSDTQIRISHSAPFSGSAHLS